MKKKKISFVIPCYKSEKTIEYVVSGIQKTIQESGKYLYEIILVNDGSPDNTFDKIKRLANQDGNVVAINLSRNFGQHSALMAGYANVTGDYVIGMDDDGEHNPKDMFKLIDELEKGYDYVCANFVSNHRTAIKNLGTRINNWMATNLIGKPSEVTFSSYYIMRRYVVDEIKKCKNPFPYVGGMIVAITKKLSSTPIEQHSRKSGESGYNLKNSFSLWLNGFTAFSVKPLRVATVTGIIMALFGFIYGIYIIIKKIVTPQLLLGYASTMVVLLVVGGILMITLGVIGEYVGRIYISINKVPQYVIKEIVSMDQKEDEKNDIYMD